MILTEDNAAEFAAWCEGKLVHEIDEKDPEILHPAVNFAGENGIERAHVGDELGYNPYLGRYKIINKA
jgi:hypothetical protein